MRRAQSSDSCSIWRAPEATHIDVRGLQPPQPMVAILRMLDDGDVGSVVIAHLDREPIYLYPELDDRGWRHEIVTAAATGDDHDDDEVIVRLTRSSA